MLDRGRTRCQEVIQRNREVSRSYTEEEGGVGMLDRGRARCRDVKQWKSEVSRC